MIKRFLRLFRYVRDLEKGAHENGRLYAEYVHKYEDSAREVTWLKEKLALEFGFQDELKEHARWLRSERDQLLNRLLTGSGVAPIYPKSPGEIEQERESERYASEHPGPKGLREMNQQDRFKLFNKVAGEVTAFKQKSEVK